MRFLPARSLVPVQAAVATGALLVALAWPPASGAMLVVPLAGGGARAAVGAVLAGGGALVATGPIGGSIVVIGDRARIARHLARWTVIVAAPPSGCGALAGGAVA